MSVKKKCESCGGVLTEMNHNLITEYGEHTHLCSDCVYSYQSGIYAVASRVTAGQGR